MFNGRPTFSELMLLIIVCLMVFAMFGCTAPPEPPPVQAAPTVTVEDLRALAKNSTCSKTNFKERGVAKAGYFEGMVLTYARALCNPTRSDVILTSKKPGADKTRDALSHYGLNPENPLRTTWQLLIGLGMRESSGRYCVGRDASASNLEHDTTEAGLFQTSYNSRKADPVLVELYDKYKSNSAGCLLDIFKAGVSCNAANLKNHGEGEGVRYQKLNKECPAFAAEYAAVMTRVRRNHYGPYNIKSAQLINSCEDLLKEVEAKLKASPSTCDLLLDI
jgi:hypothetical protein